MLLAWEASVLPLYESRRLSRLFYILREVEQGVFLCFVYINMDENTSLVRRMYERVVNEGDLDALGDFFLPDVIDHEPFPLQPSGIEGVGYKFTIMRLAFPNGTHEVGDIIAESDKVVVLGTFEGNQMGEYLGRKASGERVKVQEISVFRIENGKVAEMWGGLDEYKVVKSLE